MTKLDIQVFTGVVIDVKVAPKLIFNFLSRIFGPVRMQTIIII